MTNDKTCSVGLQELGNTDAGRNVSADSAVKVSVFAQMCGLLMPNFITVVSDA
jgi:hypothetical protein